MPPPPVRRTNWYTEATRLNAKTGIVYIDLNRDSDPDESQKTRAEPPRDGDAVLIAPALLPGVLRPPDGQAKGEFQVGLDPESGRATWVALKYPDGLTPTDLQRFPWSMFIAIADTAERGLRDHPLSESADELSRMTWAQLGGRRVRKRAKSPRRPGRRGHPDSHYQEVARRYVELRQQGLRNPTLTIAKEWPASRDTVAGWVRGARERGFLPPARPGRAG